MKKENSNDLTSSKERRKTAWFKERVQVTRLCDPAWYNGGGVFVFGIKVSYPNKVTSLVQKEN